MIQQTTHLLSLIGKPPNQLAKPHLEAKWESTQLQNTLWIANLFIIHCSYPL